MKILHVTPSETIPDPLSTDSIAAHIGQLVNKQNQSSNIDSVNITSVINEQPFDVVSPHDVIHSHVQPSAQTLQRLVATGNPILQVFHMPVDAKTVEELLPYAALPFVSFSNHQARTMPEMNWITTIPHGIDTDNIYTFAPEKPREGLLYLGRIVPQKGVHWAIAASLASGKPLTIAGKIEDADYWQEQVEPYLNDKKVFYVGEVSGNDKVNLLQRAEALLFPSLGPETFGMSATEALACGTPVIGTDQGAIPEIVDGTTTGFLAHSISDMCRAIDSLDGLAPPHVRRAIAVAKYSISAMSEAYSRAYYSVLDNVSRTVSL